MYKQRPIRDKKGKIIKQELQSKELPSTRIVPDRRWFGNTRVIGQKQLAEFRDEMAEKTADGYQVILKQKKLPLSLLADPEKGRSRRVKLLNQTPFSSVFGAKKTRKKPNLQMDDISSNGANCRVGRRGVRRRDRDWRTARPRLGNCRRWRSQSWWRRVISKRTVQAHLGRVV